MPIWHTAPHMNHAVDCGPSGAHQQDDQPTDQPSRERRISRVKGLRCAGLFCSTSRPSFAGSGYKRQTLLAGSLTSENAMRFRLSRHESFSCRLNSYDFSSLAFNLKQPLLCPRYAVAGLMMTIQREVGMSKWQILAVHTSRAPQSPNRSSAPCPEKTSASL